MRARQAPKRLGAHFLGVDLVLDDAGGPVAEHAHQGIAAREGEDGGLAPEDAPHVLLRRTRRRGSVNGDAPSKPL